MTTNSAYQVSPAIYGDRVVWQDEYVCPYEFIDYSSMIRDDELYDMFDKITESNILCIFDSCYSGGMEDLEKCNVLMSCAEKN